MRGGWKKGKVKASWAANTAATLYLPLLAQIFALSLCAVNQEHCPGSPQRCQDCRKAELFSLVTHLHTNHLSVHYQSISGPRSPFKNTWVLPREHRKNLAWAEADNANGKPPLPVHFWAAGDLVFVEGLMKDTVCTQLLSWEFIGSESAPASPHLHRGRNILPTPGLILPTDLWNKPGCVLWKGCSQTWCLYP